MPMKAMAYKTLSTVVDDFFAYVLFSPFLFKWFCIYKYNPWWQVLYQDAHSSSFGMLSGRCSLLHIFVPGKWS